MKNFEIITLFPELFPGPLGVSIFAKSLNKFWSMKTHDLRTYGIGNKKVVDDAVFSGLPGMLIRPDVVMNCMQNINFTGKKIFLSPRGTLLTQKKVESLILEHDNFLLLCGRYEGVDQRAINYYDFEEISIGNYVIAGGESAAFVLLESLIRKIPGVVGNDGSFENESFVNDEISEDRYTRPAKWSVDNKIIEVDQILLSGDHAKIQEYQKNSRKKIKD
ncbi:tRNA (guanosine(37)-N1)-methyltransferase TrmD [Alphaproteobacteria bacterium endosymbiont of Tiliacea citrago]|uniref:tRNA (guanosine(37)-N1)-methyltransferase TrmD n=1 Tax=Alphaproteobacteria bacterium endosymbiont of Tiliacea citrago TaxID=3077944 RepID=UPI00313B595F